MNTAEAWNTIHQMARELSASLPRLALALIIALFFLFLSRIVKTIVKRSSTGDSAHRNLRIAMARLTQGAIIVVGTLVAFTAAFPGFTPARLIGALGIGGIAIGFAFKDIFENFLAGILILFSRPFRIGDQIVYSKYEGTVEDIQTRATWIRTYDGRRVVIPNSELFKNSVIVNTAFDTRRLEYDFRIAAGEDIESAKKIVLRAIGALDEVLPQPGPDVVVTSFDQSTVTLRARWWSRSRTADVLLTQDLVLGAVKTALAEGLAKRGTGA
jgi:small conductance mechanosensitive channel